MSRVRTFLASLALASNLVACAVPKADAAHSSAPAKPVPVIVVKDTQRAQVRAKLAERRKLTIERFLAYREARVYPINAHVPGMAHVWLDELGNLCAAATLISYDWGRAASERVAAENNNIALASVTSGPLLDWMLTSGMTQAEIVAIQAPGFAGGDFRPEIPRDRTPEINRLHALYVDVERQIRSLDQHNLELAVDELMKHPALARALLDGKTASAGRFGVPREGEGPRWAQPVAPSLEG